MRAYVVEPPAGAFRKVDLPRPAPPAGQVLLRSVKFSMLQ